MINKKKKKKREKNDRCTLHWVFERFNGTFLSIEVLAVRPTHVRLCMCVAPSTRFVWVRQKRIDMNVFLLYFIWSMQLARQTKKKYPVILFPLSKPYYYQQYMNINTKTKWMFTFALFFCFFFATRFDGRHCCGRMHCKKKLIQTDRPYAAP